MNAKLWLNPSQYLLVKVYANRRRREVSLETDVLKVCDFCQKTPGKTTIEFVFELVITAVI